MEQGKNHDVNPKLTANPLSLLVFWWLKDLFWKGTKKDLDYSDLYDTLPVHKSIVLGHKLERNWFAELEDSRTNQRRPKLLNAIWRTFHVRFILYGCGLFIHNCVFVVMGPVLLKLLVQHFGPDATSSWGEASRHAAGLVLCGLTAAVLGHHCNCGNLALGMAVRAACCSLVYRKTLHVSKTALGQTTSVQLVEVLSSDLKRFEQSTFFLHYVWIAPVQAAVVAAIAWRSVGASALIGVGAIFLQTVPVQIMISKCTAGLRRKITSQTGERVGLIKDVINGMQSIKILAWETHIEKLIDLARRRETDLMLKASHLRGLAVSFIVLPERVALFLTLGAYVLLGNHDITADKVFSIAAFYHILNRNMAIRFPNAVQIASETMNSIKRIQKYLLEKEFESKATCASRHGTVHGEKADVTLVDATARWTSSAICETIFKISLSVMHGKLCAVIGPPGSGKSSLLQAVLGELPLSSGAAAVGGDISYASQEPWLFVGSVRQNILLGRPYEPRRYKEVVRVCALQRDFELLPDGDKTIIGEKGASLGPGQRARINLARAVYRKSDIYLLDDPLSTIDSHIGQHILEDCIYSYLHKKTRIIVTSQLQCVERADHIVVMNNGQIEIQGTYQELQASKLNFETILTKNEVEVEEHIHDSLTREISYISTQSSAGGDEDEEADVAGGGEASESPFLGDRAAAARAGWLRSGGGAARLAGLALLLLLCQAAASGSDYWVAFWTKQEEVRGLYEEFRPDDANSSLAGGRLEAAGAAPPPDLSRDLANGTGSSFSQPPPGREALLCVFASCVAATALLTAGRSLLLGAACVAAARRLHADLCRALLRAPLGFFRRVPPERILKRLSSDFSIIDETLPRTLTESIQICLVISGALILMMITNYILIVPMVFVAAAIYKMRNIFTRTIQAMRRLEGTTCGPVLTHLSSTLEGLATIRAGGSQEVMSMDYYTYQDIHTSAFYLLCTTVTASAFWFDIVVNIFVGCVCYSFLILENAAGAAAADVGLAVQQSLLLVGTLHYCVRCAAESAAHLGSVRRALDYASLPPEEGLQPGTGNEPPPTWPSKGAIQFDHLTLRYSSDSPPALRDVTVNIEPGQKVGVVGRPGAGKSALLAALLRLAPTDGAARLDGTDTRTVSVRRLRRRVSVLEARPAVFPASLRDNLDPERGRRDSELWAALREVGMKDAERTLLIPVGSGGGHHSLEQKQLICLARAVLAGNKILVMDEATANADLQTASLIHETVRKKFKDCTVLTMTQDPRIVIGCDRIMVMSAGTMVEFGHPHLLLLNPEGHFYKLVQECGTSVAKELYREAQESYRRNEPEAETPEIEDD